MDRTAHIEIQNIDITEGKKEGFFPIKITTTIGAVECRYYHAFNPRAAVLFAGGARSDWDTPAHTLYPRLCRDLTQQSVSSLWVKYRYPLELEESIYDVLITIFFLKTIGIYSLGLVGFSIGGAVMIQAAAMSPEITAVTTLSTQVFGTEVVSKITNTPLLLIHGSQDKTLPTYCSQLIHEMANEPKELMILENTGHDLEESADTVLSATKGFLLKYLL